MHNINILCAGHTVELRYLEYQYHVDMWFVSPNLIFLKIPRFYCTISYAQFSLIPTTYHYCLISTSHAKSMISCVHNLWLWYYQILCQISMKYVYVEGKRSLWNTFNWILKHMNWLVSFRVTLGIYDTHFEMEKNSLSEVTAISF